MTTFIIYPEKRWVPAKQIASWYADAIANKEIDTLRFPHCRTIAEMAAALDDAGIITRGAA